MSALNEQVAQTTRELQRLREALGQAPSSDITVPDRERLGRLVTSLLGALESMPISSRAASRETELATPATGDEYGQVLCKELLARYGTAEVSPVNGPESLPANPNRGQGPNCNDLSRMSVSFWGDDDPLQGERE